MSGALNRLLAGEDLGASEASELMLSMADGRFEPALAGGLLVALRAKGETPDEIRGFVAAMRQRARRPDIPRGPSVDVVGTGGDGSGSFNLSTGAALLAAASGVRIVKHGNRAISSQSGSADVLQALGLDLPLTEREAADCLNAIGFTYLFAPYYHPAMKAIAPVRSALGVRTVFNLLGPLLNPAEPPFLLVGAWSRGAARLLADTLAGLPIERAFVVHGAQGWDEATPIGSFLLYDVRPDSVTVSERDPAALGFARCAPDALRGGDPSRNAAALREVFDGARGAHRDALVIGAALALEVSGAVPSFADGATIARQSIDTGRAAALLARLARFVPVGQAQRAAHV